jgi:hypothetical protein
MRPLSIALTSALLLLAAGRGGDVAASKPIKVDIVFEGTVLKMAPPTPRSGLIFPYRLVKYRVERVCKGKYTGEEIVVDHQVIAGSELDGVKVGDKVGVAVKRLRTVAERWDAEGIRTPSDVVPIFYVGGGVTPAQATPCSCMDEAIRNASFFNLTKRY